MKFTKLTGLKFPKMKLFQNKQSYEIIKNQAELVYT
jgi:hypothetical protein